MMTRVAGTRRAGKLESEYGFVDRVDEAKHPSLEGAMAQGRGLAQATIDVGQVRHRY